MVIERGEGLIESAGKPMRPGKCRTLSVQKGFRELNDRGSLSGFLGIFVEASILCTMKSLLVCLSLLIMLSPPGQATAQGSERLDSLMAGLKTAKEDTNKVKTLFGITWEFLKTRTAHDSASKYADSAMALSRKLNWENGIAVVHYYKGVIDRYQGNYASGLQNFRKFHDHVVAEGDSFRIASSLYQIAVIHSLRGDYEKSLQEYLKILTIYEALQHEYSQATTLNSMGIVYKNLNKYDDALISYERALALFEKLDAEIDMADCLSNIGTVYGSRQEHGIALEYFHQALDIDTKLHNDWGIAYQLKNIGQALSSIREYDQALIYNLRALDMARKLGQMKEIAMALISAGDNYVYLGNYEKALEMLNEGLEIALSIGSRPDVSDAYRMISYTHAQQADYEKAYEYHQLYVAAKDSLLNENNLKQINELQARYETEKKQNEIALLTKDRELQHAQLIQERNLRGGFMVGVILLVLLLIILMISHRQKLKAREEIARKNEEINRRKLAELEKNQKLYALDAMISGQEVERKRIARDLHDGLGVLLSTVQNHFNSIQAEIEKIQKLDVYSKANELLDEACTEVRKIAHNMMPGTLLKLGLAPAVKDMCDNLSSASGIQIEFHAFGMDERMSEAVEITIYRLAQEALNNIIKHAKATEALVQLSHDSDQITLTVEDNGTGFHVAEAKKKGGMGLRNLESRVKYLNGVLTIESSPGKGASINVDIPVYQNAGDSITS